MSNSNDAKTQPEICRVCDKEGHSSTACRSSLRWSKCWVCLNLVSKDNTRMILSSCDKDHDLSQYTWVKEISCTGCPNQSSIPVLPFLQEIQLEYCPKISVLPESKTLQYLYLRSCPIKEIPVYPNIRKLSAVNVPISSLTQSMPRLQELRLELTSLTELSVPYPNLFRLECRGCIKLSKIPIYPQIEMLDCRQTLLTSKIIEPLTTLKNLLCEFEPSFEVCDRILKVKSNVLVTPKVKKYGTLNANCTWEKLSTCKAWIDFWCEWYNNQLDKIIVPIPWDGLIFKKVCVNYDRLVEIYNTWYEKKEKSSFSISAEAKSMSEADTKSFQILERWIRGKGPKLYPEFWKMCQTVSDIVVHRFKELSRECQNDVGKQRDFLISTAKRFVTPKQLSRDNVANGDNVVSGWQIWVDLWKKLYAEESDLIQKSLVQVLSKLSKNDSIRLREIIQTVLPELAELNAQQTWFQLDEADRQRWHSFWQKLHADYVDIYSVGSALKVSYGSYNFANYARSADIYLKSNDLDPTCSALVEQLRKDIL